MVTIKTTVIGNGSHMGESKGGRTTDMPSRNTDTLSNREGSAQFSCRFPGTKTSRAQFWNKDVKGDVLMGTLKLFLS